MTSTPKPTIAVFGATGGCAANALVLALKAGHSCTAMVRTPEKLRALLEQQYNLAPTTINAYLTIIQGNIKSSEDVERALTISGRLPDSILFAVGGKPLHQLSLSAPAMLDDPHVCEEGMKALISALRSCTAARVPLGAMGKKSSIVTISATGVSSKRDIRMHLYPVYLWYLLNPLRDKAAMEKALTAATSEHDSPLGKFALVRLMALSDAPAKGLDAVKHGWMWPDEQREEKVALGQKEAGPNKSFFVARTDVGAWIFENLLKGDCGYYGKCLTLSY